MHCLSAPFTYPKSMILVQMYVQHFRPAAIRNAGGVDCQLFFVNFAGNPFPDGSLGRQLTSFFERECNLHICSNALRSLVETTADVSNISCPISICFFAYFFPLIKMQHRRGDIDNDALQGVRNINGHSDAVARTYYQRADRVADVHAARDLLTGYSEGLEAPPAEVPVVAAPIYPTHTVYTRQIVYGEQHPWAHKSGKRIPWSDDELAWIDAWKAANLLTASDGDRALPRCYEAVKANREAHPIFHPHHMKKCEIFRNGYERRVRIV